MELADISHHTIAINRQVRELKGEYDGWETKVEHGRYRFGLASPLRRESTRSCPTCTGAGKSPRRKAIAPHASYDLAVAKGTFWLPALRFFNSEFRLIYFTRSGTKLASLAK